MKSDKRDYIIQNVLDDFNFTSVEGAMRLLKWTWGDKKVDYYPSIEDLRKVAKAV